MASVRLEALVGESALGWLAGHSITDSGCKMREVNRSGQGLPGQLSWSSVWLWRWLVWYLCGNPNSEGECVSDPLAAPGPLFLGGSLCLASVGGRLPCLMVSCFVLFGYCLLEACSLLAGSGRGGNLGAGRWTGAWRSGGRGN